MIDSNPDIALLQDVNCNKSGKLTDLSCVMFPSKTYSLHVVIQNRNIIYAHFFYGNTLCLHDHYSQGRFLKNRLKICSTIFNFNETLEEWEQNFTHWKFLICGDHFNSNSPLWSYPNENPHGETSTQYVITINLTIANIKNTETKNVIQNANYWLKTGLT